jgi:hypothetical protein
MRARACNLFARSLLHPAMITHALKLFVLCVAVNARAAALQIVPGAYSSGKAYVRCVIDGARERCFLDTGSPLTLMSSKRFGAYTNLGAASFRSASGIPQRVETIRIAKFEIDDVSVVDLRIGRANFRGAENTLGIDLVGRQPFALRFGEKNELILNATRPELPLTTLGVSAQGLLTIPIAMGEVQEVRALWDTGVAVTSVDKSFIEANRENFEPTKQSARGIDGSGRPLLLQLYRAKKIVIAERSFEDVRVIAVDLSLLRESVSKDIHAIIGFNLIRRADWFFDRKTRLWKCEP